MKMTNTTGNKLERFTTLFLVAGIGFFLLAFIGMGLAPWTTLKDVTRENRIERNELENLGRKVYMKEACWHCHTQFVRPVANEELRYGPVSDPAESVADVPQLFGTRRVGQDLSRTYGRHPDDWHFAHLYNPRHVVPWSVMPSYSWMFEKSPDGTVTPKLEAKALVAYLQTLGRDKHFEIDNFNKEYQDNFQIGTKVPKSMAMLKRGKLLFARECIACHGIHADGKGRTGTMLQPVPKSLVLTQLQPEFVYTLLHLGRPGTAMPHFREYSETDKWALAYYVNSLVSGNAQPVATAPTSAAPPVTPALLGKGKTLFTSTCISCHGPKGDGKGPAGPALNPPAANFTDATWKFGGSIEEIFKTITRGSPGTGMTPYVFLTEDERWALAAYVKSFSK
jgi:cbb3-type cytochrome oxidase cytochrome c subunit/mono/diheme cytochrome c family protein